MLVVAFCLAACSCNRGPAPEEVAAQTAKAYYDQLIAGKYEQFVDGRYLPNPIPDTYRAQLIDNMKMFVGEQEEAHRGLKQVTVVSAKADTAKRVANVFLLFHYGDSTKEEVLVPMVEHKNVWYMR